MQLPPPPPLVPRPSSIQALPHHHHHLYCCDAPPSPLPVLLRCPCQVGDSFVLNCLGEGEAEPLMKHFLKRFAAGADRFEVRHV